MRDGEKSRPTLTPVFLPFWIFDYSVSVKYQGTVGFNAGGADGKREWMQVNTWKDAGYTSYPSTHPAAQVCASFRHRLDLAAACAGPHVGSLPQSKPSAGGEGAGGAVNLASMPDVRAAALEASRDGAGPPGSVLVERFGIKRSLAWELTTRAVREIEREKARRALMQAHGAAAAKDVVLDIEYHGRKVRAVRLPAYIARFTHGETQNVNNQIVDQTHTAVVCGVTGNVVVSDDIVCHNKARLIAVASCVAPAAAAALALGPESFQLLAAQTLCASAVLSTIAGIGARQIPRMRQEREEGARVADEESAFAAATRGTGGGDAAWMAEPVQQRRDDVEWGRWMETDKTHWDEDKREEWAASIWQWQKIRRREREERRRLDAIRRARLEEAERADEEKSRRWGADWRKVERVGGGKDRRGYYKLLGLQDKMGAATLDEIKSAFRREAMEWHPDKHQGVDAKARAAKNFRQLQKAYAVLGNRQEREVYDSY